MPGLVIDIFITYIAHAIINLWRVYQSRKWPAVPATVISRSLLEPNFGCEFVEIAYKYKWEFERYSGTFREPFMFRHSETFDQVSADSEISVRVNPADPSKSIPAGA
jgi:hypothetical protein